MKSIFIAIFLVIPAFTFGQNFHPKVERIENESLLKVLPFIESFSSVRTDEMIIATFVVNNGTGSAHLPESDEVSYNILLTVSGYDEQPDSKLFSVGPFINPILSNISDLNNGAYIKVEHGIYNNRKTNKIFILPDKVAYE